MLIIRFFFVWYYYFVIFNVQCFVVYHINDTYCTFRSVRVYNSRYTYVYDLNARIKINDVFLYLVLSLKLNKNRARASFDETFDSNKSHWLTKFYNWNYLYNLPCLSTAGVCVCLYVGIKELHAPLSHSTQRERKILCLIISLLPYIHVRHVRHSHTHTHTIKTI